MADKHPYVSAPGGLVQVIKQFRNSFPGRVTAETLQKLGFAPKNESYVLNVLRFLGLIDEEGKKTDVATKMFNIHDDLRFSEEFATLVKKGYSDLFEVRGDSAWTLDTDSLITFFRSADDTTAIVGKRQASTFQLLAGFAGQKELRAARPSRAKTSKPSADEKVSKPERRIQTSPPAHAESRKIVETNAVGLTVRIEINLPADGNQETYDRIFKSIRENLLNG